MAWTGKEKRKFLEIMAGLSEIYDRQLSERSLEFYIQILSQYSFKDVERALVSYVSRASFFPTPGDIISLIDGDLKARAEKAWAEVKEALHAVGTWESIRFRDPIINVVISDLGGWIKLGEIRTKDIEFYGHEFKKLYGYYLQTGKVPKVDYLPGRVETENNARGLIEFIPPVVEVGSELPSSAKIALVEKAKPNKIPRLNAEHFIALKSIPEAKA